MADLLSKIEQEIRTRAAELRPAVAEYEALEEAARALGAGQRRTGQARRARPAPGATRRSAAPVKAPSQRSARNGSARAGRGERRDTVLALLRGNPQITAANLARLLDISTGNVYTTISRLRRQGAVDKKDGKWVVKPG